MIRRTIVHRRNRRNLGAAEQPGPGNAVATSTVVANKWRLTFNRPVLITGIPTGFTVNGAQPTGYTVVTSNVIDLAYTVNVAAGQAWVIPATSPYIRTYQGGYVAAGGGTF